MQNYSWNPVLISLFFLNWYIDTYLGFFWICNRRSYSVPNSPLCWSSQIGLAQIVRAFLRNKFRLNLYWLWSVFQWWSYLFYSLLLLLPFLSLSDNHGPPQLLMFLFILFFSPVRGGGRDACERSAYSWKFVLESQRSLAGGVDLLQRFPRSSVSMTVCARDVNNWSLKCRFEPPRSLLLLTCSPNRMIRVKMPVTRKCWFLSLQCLYLHSLTDIGPSLSTNVIKFT